MIAATYSMSWATGVDRFTWMSTLQVGVDEEGDLEHVVSGPHAVPGDIGCLVAESAPVTVGPKRVAGPLGSIVLKGQALTIHPPPLPPSAWFCPAEVGGGRTCIPGWTAYDPAQ